MAENDQDFLNSKEQTPREIVAELDKYIVGQTSAKRSVAVALRNRWRSRQLPEKIRDDVIPKNILMIGSTGVGKTEIARRLAKLVKAPFIKVEATKFTEVGYVGRDVESIIRDLVQMAVRMVREKKMEEVQDRAAELAKERIIDAFVPESKEEKNPLMKLLEAVDGSDKKSDDQSDEEKKSKYPAGRAWVKKRLDAGELENEMIEISVEDTVKPTYGSNLGSMGDNLQDMIGGLMPKRTRKRRVTVEAARKILQQEEAEKLIDMEDVADIAVQLTERNGIVFLDEIDKIASKNSYGADVSREGVQRDILPIVEGSTVMTKYGPVKTDHILFIAAGAFSSAKPSDLIPELQGRFPIRVELESLKQADFEKILTEPQNALTKQYIELLKTEGLEIDFDESAIKRIAELAEHVNDQAEDIGARRLHTLLEKLLEEISFDAPDLEEKKISIDSEYVDQKLKDISKDKDLSQFIL